MSDVDERIAAIEARIATVKEGLPDRYTIKKLTRAQLAIERALDTQIAALEEELDALCAARDHASSSLPADTPQDALRATERPQGYTDTLEGVPDPRGRLANASAIVPPRKKERAMNLTRMSHDDLLSYHEELIGEREYAKAEGDEAHARALAKEIAHVRFTLDLLEDGI